MNIDDLEKLFSHIEIQAVSKKVENHEDACLRRFREKWLFIATLLALGVVFLIGLYCAIFDRNSPQSPIAINGMIALATGLAGYFVRGKY